LILNGSQAQAVSISVDSCPYQGTSGASPKTTYHHQCTITVSDWGTHTNPKIGIYTDNYTTPGAVYDIDDYRTPTDGGLYRFTAQGQGQGSESNVTTDSSGSGVTVVLNPSGNGDYTVDLYYDTYDADIADNEYTQSFTFAFYDNNVSVDTASQSMNFTTSIISGGPTASSAPAIDFASGSITDVLIADTTASDLISVDVKSNRPYEVAVKLSDNVLTYAGKPDIGIATTSFCLANSSGVCQDTVKTFTTSFQELISSNEPTKDSDDKTLVFETYYIKYIFTNKSSDPNFPFDPGNYKVTTVIQLTVY
jgi:hypothetical protein